MFHENSFLPLAAQTQVNRNGPEAPLKFVSENPAYVLASTLKNSPTYLNCRVSVTLDRNLQNDLTNQKFYHDPSATDDDDDDDDADMSVARSRDDEEVQKLYQQQYENTRKTQNRNASSPLLIPFPKNATKTRRSARENLLFEWLKDGERILATTDGSQSANGFTLLPNGTLKFQASNLTSGEYRCRVKYADKSGKFVIGPIMSQATVVDIASE